jgi:hypothetical protein
MNVACSPTVPRAVQFFSIAAYLLFLCATGVPKKRTSRKPHLPSLNLPQRESYIPVMWLWMRALGHSSKPCAHCISARSQGKKNGFERQSSVGDR